MERCPGMRLGDQNWMNNFMCSVHMDRLTFHVSYPCIPAPAMCAWMLLHAFVCTAPSQKFSSQFNVGKIMLWSTQNDHKFFALSPMERWNLLSGPWPRTGLSDYLTDSMRQKRCSGTPELPGWKPCSFSLDLFEWLLWLRASFHIKTPTWPRDCHAREARWMSHGRQIHPAQPAGIPGHRNVRESLDPLDSFAG